MIIIIEGLDGVGKTTLSKKIAEKYNFEYIKESYTDSCKEKENRIKLMLERLFENKNYIYDRTTLIDDFVYEFLNKQQSSLNKYLEIIKAILKKCIIFHLEIDDDIRKERFNKRGDQYITEKDIEQINKNYYDFYFKLTNENQDEDNFWIFDLTDDLDKDIERMMEVVNND